MGPLVERISKVASERIARGAYDGESMETLVNILAVLERRSGLLCAVTERIGRTP